MNPIITNQEEDEFEMAIFDERIFSPLYCKVCDFCGKDLEDLIAHRKSSNHAKRVSILASRKTLVWWDINNCPVPDDLDAGLVVPGIKRVLETSGFAGGPLTITAFGDLERVLKQTPNVLPAISSSGVRLKHTEQELSHFLEWTDLNPPPATIMLICGRDIGETYPSFIGTLRNEEYTIFHYPSMEFLPPREQCCEMSMQPSAFLCETGEPAWCCIGCGLTHELFGAECLLAGSTHGESIEDLTKHLHSTLMDYLTPCCCLCAFKQELDMDGTEVWWDINSCPVPYDLDPRQVVPIIKGLLEKSDIPAGHLTITAMGDLEFILQRTPYVLPAISSAGVLLKHVPKGCDLDNELVNWTLDSEDPNPPPTDIVLISSRLMTDSRCIRFLKDCEYDNITICPSLMKPRCSHMIRMPSTAWWIENWQYAWCCVICRRTHKHFGIGEGFHGESIADFFNHLKSDCHIYIMGETRRIKSDLNPLPRYQRQV